MSGAVLHSTVVQLTRMHSAEHIEEDRLLEVVEMGKTRRR